MTDTIELSEAQTAIRLNAALVDEARANLQAAVDQAREQGTSWAAVGEALGGITRQAAWERSRRDTEAPPSSPTPNADESGARA